MLSSQRIQKQLPRMGRRKDLIKHPASYQRGPPTEARPSHPHPPLAQRRSNPPGTLDRQPLPSEVVVDPIGPPPHSRAVDRDHRKHPSADFSTCHISLWSCNIWGVQPVRHKFSLDFVSSFPVSPRSFFFFSPTLCPPGPNSVVSAGIHLLAGTKQSFLCILWGLLCRLSASSSRTVCTLSLPFPLILGPF